MIEIGQYFNNVYEENKKLRDKMKKKASNKRHHYNSKTYS